MKLKKYRFVVLLFALAVAFFACKQGDDAPPKKGSQSLLNVIDAVTDVRGIDFYLNGTRQNINSAIYLFSSSGYLRILAGEQQYQVKSDSPRTVIMDIKLNPAKTDSSYTLVVAGQAGNGTLSSIFLNDNFVTNDTLQSAKVRFVQASPGPNAYDVFVGDTVSFKNQAFKSATGFVNISPGVKDIKVMLAGDNKALIDASFILQPNTYYTLFTVGSLTGSGNNAFAAGLNLTR
jgi:hypothetical protein